MLVTYVLEEVYAAARIKHSDNLKFGRLRTEIKEHSCETHSTLEVVRGSLESMYA